MGKDSVDRHAVVQHFGLRQPAAAFINQPAGREVFMQWPIIVPHPELPQQAASTKAAAGCRSPKHGRNSRDQKFCFGTTRVFCYPEEM